MPTEEDGLKSENIKKGPVNRLLARARGFELDLARKVVVIELRAKSRS